ncbi:formate/nitrite transporter family protein [Marinobacter hydrocarbonoclasticus]|nr:formate/nitrite transporter family protein [Marinobacter nauticus]
MLSGRLTVRANPVFPAFFAALVLGLGIALYVASGAEMEHQPFQFQLLAMLTVLLICLTLMRGGELSLSNVTFGVAPELRARAWVLVGNAAGILVVLWLVQVLGASAWQQGEWGEAALNIALGKLSYGFWELVGLAALSNMGFCLALWLSRVADDAPLKLITLAAPIWLYMNTGIEHVVVNLIVVPVGILVLHCAPDGFWLLTQCDPDRFESLTLGRFFGHSLVPVLIGNLVGGGSVVGLIHLWLDRDVMDPDWLDDLNEER